MTKFGGIQARIGYTLHYLGKPRWDTGISPPELIEYLKNHKPGRALDIGCGTGTNVITMALYGWQVIGFDFTGAAVARARKKLREAGVIAEIRQADARNPVDLPGPFDLILDLGCFHSIPIEGRDGYAANVKRWIAPGGTFLMYGFIGGETKDFAGISEGDIERFGPELTLMQRADGMEGKRRSTWVTFVRKMSQG
jgi:SAM-dependent methyltransferase